MPTDTYKLVLHKNGSPILCPKCKVHVVGIDGLNDDKFKCLGKCGEAFASPETN